MIPIVLFATAFRGTSGGRPRLFGACLPGLVLLLPRGRADSPQVSGSPSNYIWNFVDVGGRLPVDPILPIASNAHWMPLAALVQVPFLLVFGNGRLGAGLAFWIVGALAAPLTYWIGRDAGFDSRPALVAGVMVAVPGGLTPFLSQPDNFGLFMTLGALSPVAVRPRHAWRSLVVRGSAGSSSAWRRWPARTAFCSGLPFALVGVRELWRALRGSKVVLPWAAVVGCAALFFVAVAPWMYRQLEVFGSFFPSASSGRILWISDYSQLYSISSPVGPDTLFANGLGGVRGQPDWRPALRARPVRVHAAGRRADPDRAHRRVGAAA